MLTLALVVSIGINFLTILILAQQRKRSNAAMTANADALNSLTGDVHQESSVVDSAIVLINGFANRLSEALASAQSPEDLTGQIQALRDEINSRAVALGQAVAANTPSANDSSSFPVTDPPAQTNDSGSSDSSTGTASSDTSAGDTTTSDSSSSGDAGADVGSGDVGLGNEGGPSSPAGDGTADVQPPVDSGTADAGEGTVVPDGGSAVSDESSSSDAPSE